jgi:hypothetical protein
MAANDAALSVDAETEYTVELCVFYRKRKPPKREPTWLTNLNPQRRYVSRTGFGAELPTLLAPEKLARILEHERQRAEAAHLIFLSLTLHTPGRQSRQLASWTVWRGEWQTRRVEVKEEGQRPHGGVEWNIPKLSRRL